MSKSRIIESAEEARAIASGEQPAPRILMYGHVYVPEAALTSERERADRAEAALEWALDNASVEHPHYPYRDGDKWTFWRLISNAGGFGGGVGEPRFASAVEAVQEAQATGDA